LKTLQVNKIDLPSGSTGFNGDDNESNEPSIEDIKD